MGRELALCYEEKRLVYRRRDALGGQEELLEAGRDGGGSGHRGQAGSKGGLDSGLLDGEGLRIEGRHRPARGREG